MVHSVQIDNSDISEMPDALLYALCAMRLHSAEAVAPGRAEFK
jgi:hypothetical protein